MTPALSMISPKPYSPLREALKGANPKRILLVASTGGHLTQLHKLVADLTHPESLWVTFRNAQSESLLKGRRVHYVPYVAPRDWRGLLRAAKLIYQRIHGETFDYALSTGAGLALAGLWVAHTQSIPCRYIESLSRLDGPSLTGRLLYYSHSAEMYTQHKSWARGRWQYEPSLLGDYRKRLRPKRFNSIPSIFVTLGTIKPYRFDSLIDAVLATGLTSTNTVWQVGETERFDLPGTVHREVDDVHFHKLISSSDVVVTHAGTGSLLTMVANGVYPVVVPRRKSRNEHVDDHQSQIAHYFHTQGLALKVEAESLASGHLMEAMRWEIETS